MDQQTTKPGCCHAGDCTPQTCMRLPGNATCEQCFRFPFCLELIGIGPDNTVCDWFPRRFQEMPPTDYRRHVS